ncbi:hypothetical protein Halha_2485 [Halobacteroides halobius DSM 5150]|uniref:Uncharacterized protein n=1 Tax=Halobacteroides halobius (strain ATCC 35273 / DSM 5150 / MD-1) TaxID=748449 RepID=L0KDB9_HALHC|nr:hypothetical protein [Halobacteroides halobius]AGB42359.1 hypothetical protein Halha_2485 [Halobacteroides halobius DSM 5150]
MIIDYQTALAWRCPKCGKLELESISIFEFAGSNKLELECNCGFIKLIIGKTGQRFWLEYPCIFCDNKHRKFYDQDEFWSNKVKGIDCSVNNTELGYFGKESEVKELIDQEEEYLEQMMDKLDFEDYFNNPDIMLSILSELHDIAQESGLVCQCGSKDIDIEMLPDEIELICEDCKGITKVKASNEEDLKSLRKLKKVKILEGVVSALEKTNV